MLGHRTLSFCLTENEFLLILVASWMAAADGYLNCCQHTCSTEIKIVGDIPLMGIYIMQSIPNYAVQSKRSFCVFTWVSDLRFRMVIDEDGNLDGSL
jgi:hypothetical protein